MSRYKLSLEEFNNMQNNINKLKQDKIDIKSQIEKLQTSLFRADLEEYLCNLKMRSPIILPLDNRVKSYKYITEPVHLSKIGVILYPLWINTRCYYPRWSDSIYSIKIEFLNREKDKDKEVIVDSISKSLSCNYEEAHNLFLNSRLSVPRIVISDYKDTDNIILNYSDGELLDEKEYPPIHFGVDNSDRMVNNISLKYILLLSDNLII